jgi:DNA polymerase-1
MELAGVKLDVEFLKKLNKLISAQIIELEQKIWDSAGVSFNIASPAQLSQVLFDKLQLSRVGVKKGKTGFSTAAGELEKLRDAHPVIPMIMDYRELTKLKSTYIDALPLMIKADGRVHTNYSQTIVPSGRLSSNNPNLQNIPVRTELGREIRKAFVAPPGRVFVSADYSQIELRVAAALSQDQSMIETFQSGIDLHQETAAEMFGVELDKVTKEQRYAAKTINFGVLYGMSPHGLSVAMGIGREEATAFIERYFEVRKTLKNYIENIKNNARTNEYTETMMGRRWPCAEINSNNFQIRNATERVAVNIPIQGTAAEIMKLAMVAVAQKIKGSSTQMLLQIHDQLILEADEKEASAVAKMLKDIMENVYDLGVPIVADTAIGKNWGEL